MTLQVVLAMKNERCSVVTPWTVTLQAPLSMGFTRQEYWSGLSFPSPGDLPGIKPVSPAWQMDSLPLSHLRSPDLSSLQIFKYAVQYCNPYHFAIFDAEAAAAAARC